MDFGDPIPSNPGSQEEPESPRAASGFYRTDLHLFYVTSDGRVVLLSAPGEPVCLRPRDGLPIDAVRAVYVTDAALLLVAETAEQLASPSGPHLRADAGRDARVLAAALLQDLLDVVKAEVGALLLDERPAGIDALHDRVEDLVTTSRLVRRRLSDQRVMCRGQSPGHPPPPATMPRLALPFRHRGDYVGWFTGMAAAGEALGVESMRDAHLRGDLWTVAQGGIVHVFRCRPVLAGCKSPTCQPSAPPPAESPRRQTM